MADPKVVRLARLPVDIDKQPELLARYWDEAMTAIETALNAILALPEIQDALVKANQAIAQAQAAAVTANKAAAAAQTSANTANAQTAAQAKEASIVESYVQALDSNPVITATPDGTVTVANHQRVYGNSTLNPTVNVAGKVVSSGFPQGRVVRVWYSDPARAGGNVNYQYTVDPTTPVAQSGDNHSVGGVVIPTSGTSAGKKVQPSGYVDLVAS